MIPPSPVYRYHSCLHATCFGDSGGPNFLGASNVVAGVTSFGLNNACGGTGGVFRLDRRDVLDFVNAYLH
jgi:secreted trypsin-like serine protease